MKIEALQKFHLSNGFGLFEVTQMAFKVSFNVTLTSTFTVTFMFHVVIKKIKNVKNYFDQSRDA